MTKKINFRPNFGQNLGPQTFFFLGGGGADLDLLGPISQKHFPRGKTSTIS